MGMTLLLLPLSPRTHLATHTAILLPPAQRQEQQDSKQHTLSAIPMSAKLLLSEEVHGVGRKCTPTWRRHRFPRLQVRAIASTFAGGLRTTRSSCVPFSMCFSCEPPYFTRSY